MAIAESNGHNEPSIERVAEEKRWWKGHVVVVPWPAQGHINPMMHLSNSLAAHGILVTFVNTQFQHDRILQARARRTSALENPDLVDKGSIRLVGIPDGLGYDEYVANFDVPKQAQALIDIEPLLVKLVEELQPSATCIIADVFVISTPAVAKRLDLPHVTFWTQNATNYAAHVFITQNHVSLKEYLERLCKEGNVDERVISCVPTCPTLSYKELPTFLRPCDPSDFLFSYLITNFQMAQLNTFILMNTFEELEVESFAFIHTPNMLCIGPLLPSQFICNDSSSTFEPKSKVMTVGTSFWVEDQEGCLPWLHQQKPTSVLYVSFGSITLMSAQQVNEFVGGLEASGCPFLMVVRPEMMVGGGSITFPLDFVDRMKNSGQAIFVPWAPQLEVLAHPAIGGFLTHAGWNSTLESICRGVPMLCWPYFADQMLNTRCIVDTWKIGLEFVADKVANNEEWTSTSGGNNDDSSSNRSSSNKNSNSEEVALVNRKEIEKKIRQIMDPLASKEMRKQIKSLSLAAKKAYESTSRSNFKSLLDVISH